MRRVSISHERYRCKSDQSSLHLAPNSIPRRLVFDYNEVMKPPAPYLGELEQLILLAILQCGDDAYTVPIRRVLADRSRRRVARGALYTSLDRLEAKGLVSSRLGES